MITFLALIRCIAEPIRLHALSHRGPDYDRAEPFLVAALVSAVMLLLMTLLHYFNRFRLIIGLGVLNLVLLIIIRQV